MKANDIKRVIDAGLANVETTQRDVDAIMEYIHESEYKKRPRRIVSARRIVLTAICVILMLTMVVQAFGLSMWKTIVVWTQESLYINMMRDGDSDSGEIDERTAFSGAERETWGDSVCDVFADYNFFPHLPEWKPEKLELESLTHTDYGHGRISVYAYYAFANEHLMLTVQKLGEEGDYAGSEMFLESDGEEAQMFEIQGINYYHTTNLDHNSFAWENDDIVFTLFTSYDVETVLSMLESIHPE